MMILLTMCYHVVAGLCDEKETITAPGINHLQESERLPPEKSGDGTVRMVDKGRPDIYRGCMMEHAERSEETCQSLCRGKFLELIKEGRWEYVSRVNANGAVMIVAVTKEGELLLVEEYRVPLHAHTIGLPAGISGDEGEESTLQSARRELEEETGYRAEAWTYLFTGPSSPGLTTEMVSFYLADGLQKISDGGGVEHENITVHRIPLSMVHDWLMDQIGQGKVVDPKIFMGLYFLSLPGHSSGREE